MTNIYLYAQMEEQSYRVARKTGADQFKVFEQLQLIAGDNLGAIGYAADALIDFYQRGQADAKAQHDAAPDHAG